jgi:hypothetical protein
MVYHSIVSQLRQRRIQYVPQDMLLLPGTKPLVRSAPTSPGTDRNGMGLDLTRLAVSVDEPQSDANESPIVIPRSPRFKVWRPMGSFRSPKS